MANSSDVPCQPAVDLSEADERGQPEDVRQGVVHNSGVPAVAAARSREAANFDRVGSQDSFDLE